MNYEQMSDLEINKAVESLESPLAAGILTPDYCNSWSDMGQIIPSISEDLFSKPDWCLLNRNLWEYWTDACGGNMCRAAAIVYLMSKGG